MSWQQCANNYTNPTKFGGFVLSVDIYSELRRALINNCLKT